MTKQEFFKKLQDAGYIRKMSPSFVGQEWTFVDALLNPPTISVQWTTGGHTGKGMYGDSTPTPIAAEAQPDFDALYEVLELVAPNITFLQSKRLCREVIQSTTDYNYGYYGDVTHYAKETVDLFQLYDFLDKNNLLK